MDSEAIVRLVSVVLVVACVVLIVSRRKGPKPPE